MSTGSTIPAASRGNGMTIGMLAKAVGIGVETIRYYQRIGLMSTPQRGYGSVRRLRVATSGRFLQA